MIIGLIGKPSAGKSSFFKGATMIDVKTSPVPFTTITPNTGMSHVVIDCVCREFNITCNPKHGHCRDGKRFIPVRLVDVGGLIPGSHLGKGIGNKFLDEIRQASVLIQIVDASGLTDEEGKPTENFDPAKEIQFLEDEINLWFESVIKRNIEKLKLPSGEAELINLLHEKLSGLEVTKQNLADTLEKSSVNDTKNFAKILRELSKPILIAANKIDLPPAQENFNRLKETNKQIVPTSAESEIALKKAEEKTLVKYKGSNGFEIIGNVDEAQRKGLEFIKREVIDKFGSTGVQECLNKAVFEILNYTAVYPVENENKLTDSKGNVLPDVYLLPNESTTLDLGFKIHTDIGERFICAIDARTKKKLGKDYEIKDKDIIKIMVSK